MYIYIYIHTHIHIYIYIYYKHYCIVLDRSTLHYSIISYYIILYGALPLAELLHLPPVERLQA